MNYYDLSRNFWNQYRDKAFGHVDTAVYFYLLNECNIRRWLNPFELQTRNLEIMLGISRKTIGEARTRLKERGVIDFKEGKGRGATIYKIEGLDTNNETLKDVFCVSSCVSSCVSPTKHKKGGCVSSTKHKKNVVLPSSFPHETQKETQTQNTPIYIEDNIRHKDITTSRDVVAPVAPPQMELDLFSEEGKKKKHKKRADKAPPDPPTLEQVNQHFLANNADRRLQNWEASARLFYDTFNADGWVNKYGRRISNWESEANKWIFYREEAEKKQQSTPKAHETKQSDRLSERRGTEPGAKSRKGFKGAF